MMNAIIELKDIKRDFLVGSETVHCGEYHLPFRMGNL